MKISGFTMVRNADKYYFPIKASIESILPIVDEFVVALGDCDEDDNTRAIIESIGSPKVKIFDRIWSEKDFIDGKIFANETTFALNQCSGDWCFYLQADEVVHEKDHATIVKACKACQNREDIDGLLFKYYHFWGDYQHYLPFHGWYRNEIRLVKNHRKIFSYKDAQSFRKNEDDLLSVKEINARIYHYGWVRPPHLMQSKKKEQDSMHHGVDEINKSYQLKPNEYDYGPLGKVPQFKNSHPEVMKEWMQTMNWQEKLNQTRSGKPNRIPVKHERTKYRAITWIENNILGGRQIFGYKNWKKVK